VGFTVVELNYLDRLRRELDIEECLDDVRPSFLQEEKDLTEISLRSLQPGRRI